MKPIKLYTAKQIAAVRNARKSLKIMSNDAPAETKELRQKALATAKAEFPCRVVGELVEQVNGRATTHTHSWTDIQDAVIDAEIQLEKSGVTVANRPGTMVVCISELPTSKAYNRSARTAIGSKFAIERRSSAWYLVSYVKEERYTGPGAHARTKTEITEAAKQDIIKTALEGYTIKAVPVLTEA